MFEVSVHGWSGKKFVGYFTTELEAQKCRAHFGELGHTDCFGVERWYDRSTYRRNDAYDGLIYIVECVPFTSCEAWIEAEKEEAEWNEHCEEMDARERRECEDNE